MTYKRFYAKLTTIIATHHPERVREAQRKQDTSYFVRRITNMVRPPDYWDGTSLYGNPAAEHDINKIEAIVRAVLGIGVQYGTA